MPLVLGRWCVQGCQCSGGLRGACIPGTQVPSLPWMVRLALSSACPPGTLARHTYTPCAPHASSGILQGHNPGVGLHGGHRQGVPSPRPPLLTAAPRPARCGWGAAPHRPSATPDVPVGLLRRCRRTRQCHQLPWPGSPVSPGPSKDHQRHRHRKRHHLGGMQSHAGTQQSGHPWHGAAPWCGSSPWTSTRAKVSAVPTRLVTRQR